MRKIIACVTLVCFVFSTLFVVVHPVAAQHIAHALGEEAALLSSDTANSGQMSCHESQNALADPSSDAGQKSYDQNNNGNDPKSCCDVACHVAAILDASYEFLPGGAVNPEFAVFKKLNTLDPQAMGHPPRSL